MNQITLTVQPITRAESQVLKKFGLRTFAELDQKGKPCAFFGEVHESTLTEVPRKPIITRNRKRAPIKGHQLLRSVPAKQRQPIARGTQLDQVAAYCHRRLKTGPVARATLEEGIMKDLGLEDRQARPAVSDLLTASRYNHLRLAE